MSLRALFRYVDLDIRIVLGGIEESSGERRFFQKTTGKPAQKITCFVLKLHVTCPFVASPVKMIFVSGDEGVEGTRKTNDESKPVFCLIRLVDGIIC